MKEIISEFPVGDKRCKLVTACANGEMIVAKLYYPNEDDTFAEHEYPTWYWGVDNLQAAHVIAIKYFGLEKQDESSNQ